MWRLVIAGLTVGMVSEILFAKRLHFQRDGFTLPDDLQGLGLAWAPDGEDLVVLGIGRGGIGVAELRSVGGRRHWRVSSFPLRVPSWRLAAFRRMRRPLP